MAQAPLHLMFSRTTVREADIARIDAAIVRLRRRRVPEQIRRSCGGNC